MYNNIEPAVIDQELLQKCIHEQIPSEILQMANEEGIDYEDVNTLRLDYRNILKIDNLKPFINLKKLQLDNNVIEKIENLQFLVNLEWLDLSFNNITVIEGLNTLKKLTDLSLHNNRITKLDNLDELTQLNVLSIGNNDLKELNMLSYLSKFSNLRILNCTGNPLCKDPDYKWYILAHLRNLRFLDYRLVDDDSIRIARERYLDELIAIEEEEKIANSQAQEKKTMQAEEKEFEMAHIEGLTTFLEDLFAQDEDFQKLFPVIHDDFPTIHTPFATALQTKLTELKDFALGKMHEKKSEFLNFSTCLAEGKQEHDGHCLAAIKTFKKKKKQFLKSIPSNQQSMREALEDIRRSNKELTNLLMSHEMTLVEQVEDVLKDFERAYADITANVVEYAQGFFSQMREMENDFNEKFGEFVMNCADRLNKANVDELDDYVRDLIGDKELLTGYINGSHENRLAKFDRQEDLLIAGSNKELETTIATLQNEEIKRNRRRVEEIILFQQRCSSEIDAMDDTLA